RGQVEESLFRIRPAPELLPFPELVQVGAVPTHGDLKHVVERRQRQIRGHQQAAPNRRVRTQQGDLDLKDFSYGSLVFGWHITMLHSAFMCAVVLFPAAGSEGPRWLKIKSPNFERSEEHTSELQS